MSELAIIFFVLGILALLLIGFITVLRWLFTLFGGGSGAAPEPVKLVAPARLENSASPAVCANCGAALQPTDLYCQLCGQPQAQSLRNAQADLAITERVIRQLHRVRRLDEDTFSRITEALEQEKTLLTSRANQPAVPPVLQPEPAYQHPSTFSTLTSPPRTVSATPLTATEVPEPPPRSVNPPVAPASHDTAPPVPRRSFTEILTVFMEESSIRWGELIGGLFIIGCSLALVVSLWSEISERPLLKFGIFMGMTASMFGLGFYSAHKWKLPTTSRGVLLTATLLVPLNFLAVTAFGRAVPASLGIVLAEVFAGLFFAGLVWLAGNIVAEQQRVWLTTGTLGVSLALLLAKHLAPAGLNWRSWWLLGLLPVLVCLTSVGGALRLARLASAEDLKRTSYGLFTVLGVSAFAAMLPLGLLQLRAESWSRALHENAPLVALLGLPALATGWWLWRNLREAALATERTLAASLAICGAGLLVGSALLAFPLVSALVVIALLNTLVWGAAAWWYELRLVRWLALAQTAWSFLLLALLALGRLSWDAETARTLLATLFSYTSGVLLLLVFTGLTGVAEGRRARNRAATATQDFALAGLLAGLCSLALVSLHGFGVAGDPQHLAWVWSFYALATFVLAWRRDQVLYSWSGLLLLGGVAVQTCVYQFGWPQGWRHATIISFLAWATAAALLALGSLWRSERARILLTKPALLTAFVGALAASLGLLPHHEGANASYLAPLLFVALTCVIYAARCGGAAAAMAGGVLFNLIVTLAYVIRISNQGWSLGSPELARLAQLNLLTGAVYALGWRQALRRIAPPAWLRWQVRALVLAGLGLLALSALRLIIAPEMISLWVQSCGDALGWVTFGLVALSYLFVVPLSGGSLPPPNQPAQPPSQLASRRLASLTLGLLSSGTLLACTLHHFERQNWLGYHTLVATVAVTAWALLWLLLQSRRQADAPPTGWRGWLNSLNAPHAVQRATFSAILLSGTTVLLGLLGFPAPGGPWRGVIAVAAMAGLHLGLALARRRGVYFYVAGLLACVALTEWIFGYSKGGGSLLDVVMLNVALLAAVALISLALELKVLRPATTATAPAFHQFVVVLLLALTCLKVGLGLELDFVGGTPLPIQSWTGGVALAAILSLCLACIWDGLFAYRFLVLFVAGLATLGVWLDRQNWQAQVLGVSVAVGLTGYAFSAAALWRQRERLAELLRPARIPQLDWRGEAGLWWLTKTNALLTLAAVLAAGWSALAVERLSWRVLAASVALLAPLALGWVAQGKGRLRRQTLAVALAFASLVFWAWAWIPRFYPDGIYARLVLLLALALGAALIFYCLPAARRFEWSALGDWEAATQRVLRVVAATGLGTLFLTLLVEWLELNLAGGELPFWAKTVVTTTLVALTGAQIGFALWPGRDPFGWPLERRGRYVYAAEFFAVLTLAHVRMIAPWLFGGAFKAYWPLLVLVLAFVGVGISEQLRRRGRLVLAEPLARTGVFLPLLPSLGYWLIESRVDYAGLLLAVGLFYGLLSVMRQSFGFGLLAALAANGGWWQWLHRTEDYGFLAHPQVWLIPAALSVMLAAHLNRAQLSQAQMTTIRYTALMTIYVSSTADIFITGVGRSPWLPLVLAILSAAGVMLGMLLRVRAYLFLGLSFLLLALISLVWHAALSLGWGWLWFVVGIGFGVFILYLFALFERKRAQVLGLMEQLKSWQA